jgi:hypothetical protein
VRFYACGRVPGENLYSASALVWSRVHGCRDLRRDALSDSNNISRKRNKTDAEVFIPLPPAVAEMLRALPNDHPDYFFWNPGRMKKTSIVAMFGDWLRHGVRQGLVYDTDGKRCCRIASATPSPLKCS